MRRRLGLFAGKVQDGEDVAADAACGATGDEAAHLGEKVLSLPWLHQAVIGGGGHHRDIFFSGEFFNVDAADDLNVVEVAAAFNLFA